MAEQQQPPDPTLARLNENELAVWSLVNGTQSRRGGLEPLTAAERAEFAPFAEVLQRAKAAGFRARHAIIDARQSGDDQSELKVTREHGGVVEVIVLAGADWAQAFRVAPGAALLDGPAELDGAPGEVLDQVLAGAWPETEGRA